MDTRVGKTDSGGAKTYKRDGVGGTASVLSDGSSAYTPGISVRTSGATKFMHSDFQKTVTSETSSAQTVAATRTYDAFGLMAASSGSSASPFGFAGGFGYQEDPDSGLKLLGHRYYDPSTGRFLTRDPIKDGRNWYGYCANNPIKAVDPDGQIAWFAVIAIAIVVIDIIDAANDVKDIVENPTDPKVYIAPVIGMIDPSPGNWGKRGFKLFRFGAIKMAKEEAQDQVSRAVKQGYPAGLSTSDSPHPID